MSTTKTTISSKLVLLVLVLAISQCYSLGITPNTQHIQPYIDSYVRALNQLDQSGRHPSTYHEHNGHKCTHDSHSHYHESNINILPGSKSVAANLKSVNYERHSMAAVAEVQPHPVRIMLNTTYLNNGSQPSACYSVGQTVAIGKGASRGACKMDDESFVPCTWTCTAEDVITPELVALIKETIMPTILQTFTHYLTTNGSDTTTIFKIVECDDTRIIIDQRNGFSGDYALYVTAHPNFPSVIATGGLCALFEDDGPAAGFLNFNPLKFAAFAKSGTSGQTWMSFLGVSIHESVHALGFSQYLFQNYLDRSTRAKYSYPIVTTQLYNGMTPSGESYQRPRYFLSSPTVLAITKSHFNCDQMPGAELENRGSNTSSHWKATAFGEEIMLGFALPVYPLSNLTLAALYDSGWWGLSNLTGVDPLVWGRNKGCAFAMEPCSPATWNFTGYWNDTAATSKYSTYGCTATRSGVGTWAARNYSGTYELKPYEQHFSQSPYLGFYLPFRDYCVSNDVVFLNSNYYCSDVTVKNTSQYEQFGPQSRCFDSQATSGSPVRPTCYPQKCSEDNTLMIQVNGEWNSCANTPSFTSSGVTVYCPDKSYTFCDRLLFASPPSNVPVVPTSPPLPNITSSNPTLTPTTTTTTNKPSAGGILSTGSAWIIVTISLIFTLLN
ncbi:hypothetical protein SAMD00019534_055180 [Acytostelium subglobosum LB1]|uniref:hypothetical protein n=1 Tax=Acytostelium subglobosum LB1 TaxID=1410327 RepID=UPI00064503B7|nr:hypothetical protein SAMD00019534_055180 [Acytostelium subglobosum LB1]GAM22343.1 hypothetical protein SAMD00019534_055180 [Acytostelium subglobosum LB1]|eukprot:XP_012754463.1 hypothetical protein SAMD00019534_055180 [Acytostelium subglobosum LB1]